jgi:hypothetical protein
MIEIHENFRKKKNYCKLDSFFLIKIFDIQILEKATVAHINFQMH